ncbi:copper resistance protein CopC [Bacillus sp. BRMEA1]|uniref:copper resistance CopC family protein n=1 Tax=Neobacillus endophyticus TaxID=2738405 RepID=UPI00156309DB|nr:copper resistance CopC family protein [Neobacillus endophyticus]NRD78075.1 copper resistance protein CopC [Neobacillus endophyticus]
MFKKISMITPILFFLLGMNVFAHSSLEYSNPKNGEVVIDTLKEIKLSFESNIENTSSLTVKNSKNTSIPLTKVSVKGNQLVGDLNEELANGSYTIHWKVFAIDSHPFEGDISFSVKSPVTKTAAASPAAQAQTNAATPEKKTMNTASTSTQTTEPSITNYIVPVSVCLFIIIIMVCYWLIFRRKHI